LAPPAVYRTIPCAWLFLRLGLALGPVLLGACAALVPPEPTPGPSQDLLVEELRRVAAGLEDARAERQELVAAVAAQDDILSAVAEALGRLETLVSAPAAPPAPPPALSRDLDGTARALAGKQLVGRREAVWIEDLQLALPARIDTGAETASLDARNIAEFERDGNAWVRFEMVHPQGDEPLTLERPVARVVRILQSTSEEAERRLVIELGIVLGDVRQLAEFTLSNRSHLDFQVLVGRNILQDLMIVDVGQSNIAPHRQTAPEVP
jgi:hypothetical protein